MEMKEELNGEKTNMIDQTRAYYNVYKTTTGLFVNEDLCNEYNIGDHNNTKVIKDKNCL
jgi:hypothetical protein